MADDEPQYEFLRTLVTTWLAKIDLGIQKKKAFQDVSDQCMAFFAGATDYQWQEQHKKKFLRGKLNPKFKLSLNKAYELVALFAPVIYARNPVRTCKPHKPVEYDPGLLAEALGYDAQTMQVLEYAHQQLMQSNGQPVDPQVQRQGMMFQQVQQQIQGLLLQDGSEKQSTKLACDLTERYLSYTPREQPGGGLETHAVDAITEALIKGRGLLWPAPYRMPGSQLLLTGCFYDSVDNLVTDPDATSFEFGNTMWIARRHRWPTWKVERYFPHLKPGSLKKKGDLESAEAQAGRKGMKLGNLERQRGNSFDLITWWEIFSLGGVGTRLTGASKALGEAFDEVVGDYAYICVAKGVPYPLNAPSSVVMEADEDQVQEMFSWPVPYWLDRRWPCVALDFQKKPGTPWPIAPMAPGLAELTALNIIISHLVNRVWWSSRTLVAVLQSAAADVETKLRNGEDLAFVRLNEIHEDINKVVTFLQQPDVSYDAWRIVQHLFDLFDKRVGLTELLYGVQNKVSRTAADVNVRAEQMSVRPDHMAKQVESWQSQCAQMEKFCAYWAGVEGKDVKGLLGTLGSQLWDKYVVEADPEVILREMDAQVEAGSIRKPNRQRDAANVQQIFPALTQEFSKHADVTGDTSQQNALVKRFAEAIEFDLTGMEMGPRTPPPPPPPPPEVMEQQQQQAEQQEQIQQSMWQSEEDRKQASHDQELQQDQEEHVQEMTQDFQEGQQRLDLQRALARMQRISKAGNGQPVGA